MASEVLKLKARDELIRVTEEELKTPFASLNAKQQSVAAARFYIRQIRNVKSSEIEEDDLKEGIVDGKDDLGCDFICRQDGQVLVMQCKYRKHNANEDAVDISHFQSVLLRFRNDRLQANRALREALDEIEWETDQFSLVYICFSHLGPQAKTLAQGDGRYPDDVSELRDRCDWNYFDETELNQELRGARELSRAEFTKEFRLYPGDKDNRDAVISIEAGGQKSYAMILEAPQLVAAYHTLGKDALFSLNIRSFIGNTNTNKKIIETATLDPNNFYLFNNGVSCLARRVVISDSHIDVVGLQVINGAQTVRSLVRASRKWGKDKPKILVRITEVQEGYGPSAKIREQITKSNNTQNTIKISDFRSNDPVQFELVKQFSGIVRNGNRVAYLPKRTDRIPTQGVTVKLEEFAKSVYAFMRDPTDFTNSATFLFDDTKAGGYCTVFGDGVQVWERMPQDEFESRAAMYWIAQEFGVHLREARESESDPDARASLERKWLLVYAAARTLEYYFPGEHFKAQLRKLSRGEWSLKKVNSDKKSEMLRQVFNCAKGGVVMAYRMAKKRGHGFEHRKWIRSKETPKEIQELLVDIVLPTQPKLGEIPK